jgi:3-deoxy-manno-octulosonate cytidylyltransferase (CMP-KDO synthetase)
MVLHVWARCREANCFSHVIIATDDQRIAAVAAEAGAQVAMTDPTCASGTDRVAEVARQHRLSPDSVVVNVQGDEPAVHPEALQQLAALFVDPTVHMGTLIRPLDEPERHNPNIVKVVLRESRDALYFSRSDIPHQRDGAPAPLRWAHLGLYGYRASVIQRLAAAAPSALERSESLEQLRALELGITIRCGITQHRSTAVDVPADVAAAEVALKMLGR